MRLQKAARTSAFVLKFRAEKPGDPGPRGGVTSEAALPL